MGFKVRFEINPESDEEIVIKCKALTEEVLQIERFINCNSASEMELQLGGKDYFIPINEILFFESTDPKTAAHTKDRMFYTPLKLYELEERLPRNFMRVAKSCIINLNSISSLRKELTGICEVCFKGTNKKIFVSRSYYKAFREKINEIRKV